MYLFALLLILKKITMSDVTTKVKAIIVDKLGVDDSEVTPTASFTDDLGADSLDTVELLSFSNLYSIPDDQRKTWLVIVSL